MFTLLAYSDSWLVYLGVGIACVSFCVAVVPLRTSYCARPHSRRRPSSRLAPLEGSSAGELAASFDIALGYTPKQG